MCSMCLDAWKLCLKLCILTILAHMGGWTQSGYQHYQLKILNIDIDTFIELLYQSIHPINQALKQVVSTWNWDSCPHVASICGSVKLKMDLLWWSGYGYLKVLMSILRSSGIIMRTWAWPRQSVWSSAQLGSASGWLQLLNSGHSVGPWAGEYNCVGGNISADTATI